MVCVHQIHVPRRLDIRQEPRHSAPFLAVTFSNKYREEKKEVFFPLYEFEALFLNHLMNIIPTRPNHPSIPSIIKATTMPHSEQDIRI